MGADVSGKGGMAQLVLNLLHGNALTEQARRTAMPEIIKTDMPQIATVQQQLNMVRNITKRRRKALENIRLLAAGGL